MQSKLLVLFFSTLLLHIWKSLFYHSCCMKMKNPVHDARGMSTYLWFFEESVRRSRVWKKKLEVEIVAICCCCLFSQDLISWQMKLSCGNFFFFFLLLKEFFHLHFLLSLLSNVWKCLYFYTKVKSCCLAFGQQQFERETLIFYFRFSIQFFSFLYYRRFLLFFLIHWLYFCS